MSRLRYLFVFLLGVLVGAASLVPLVGGRVEELEVERRRLQLDLDKAQRDLKQLQNAKQSWTNPVVRSVEWEWANVDERGLQFKLEERLKPLVQGLVGREVRGLDPVLILGLLRDRTWKIGEKEYRPELKAAVIGEEIYLLLEVRASPARGPAQAD